MHTSTHRCRLDVAHALAPPEDPPTDQAGPEQHTGVGEGGGEGGGGPPPTVASSVLGDTSYLQRHSCSTGMMMMMMMMHGNACYLEVAIPTHHYTDHTVGSSMVAGMVVEQLPAMAQHLESEAHSAEGGVAPETVPEAPSTGPVETLSVAPQS